MLGHPLRHWPNINMIKVTLQQRLLFAGLEHDTVYSIMQSRLDLGNLKRGYKKWACIETRTKHLTCIETRPNKKASMRRCVYARYRLITLRKNYEKIRNL